MQALIESNKEKTFLQQKRENLTQKREQLLGDFEEAARKGSSNSRLSRICDRICQTKEFLDALDRIEQEKTLADSAENNRYVISSLFLHECFKDLTKTVEEEFFFVTGTIINGIYVLDQKAEFQHQKRSVVGVTGQTTSTHKLLIKLEQFRHRLLGCFHSHPGKGPDSTHPSGIDENFQTRLEGGGHVAVGAIFSRDGYVRFFRMDKSPEIEIYGEGVEKHGQNIFRLTNLDKA
jgi:hypothetical protein